jgi:hypothetical protein
MQGCGEWACGCVNRNGAEAQLLRHCDGVSDPDSYGERRTTDAIPLLQRAHFVVWGLLHAGTQANASVRKDEHLLSGTLRPGGFAVN